jgi:hypothetical protein
MPTSVLCCSRPAHAFRVLKRPCTLSGCGGTPSRVQHNLDSPPRPTSKGPEHVARRDFKRTQRMDMPSGASGLLALTNQTCVWFARSASMCALAPTSPWHFRHLVADQDCTRIINWTAVQCQMSSFMVHAQQARCELKLTVHCLPCTPFLPTRQCLPSRLHPHARRQHQDPPLLTKPKRLVWSKIYALGRQQIFR